MKCQDCHENEAENSFVVVHPGGSTEVHLCAECARLATKYYQMAQRIRDGRLPGPARPGRRLGESPFPASAGGEVRKKVRLNALRARLEQAVEAENYEEAARLRDALADAEKDVIAV